MTSAAIGSKRAKPQWRCLIEAALSKADNPNTASFLQLATNDQERGAQVRTLVWRGFTEANHHLLMATDLTTDKVAQLTVDPRAQILWYFTQAREQFRLSGNVVCLDLNAPSQEQRNAVWARLSSRAKHSFLLTKMGEEGKGANTLSHTETPPINFAVLELQVSEVDYLNIRSEPHCRTQYQLIKGVWCAKTVAL